MYSNYITYGVNDPIAKDIFPEFAISLFYFIEKLYETLIEQGINQVYFLSREGQPLMRMFDLYCKKFDGHITSHYLEVSRRSTLLPSLAPLVEETFDTLFRQYRCISLVEFLSSLSLESHIKSIVPSLGLSEGAELQRHEDFPTSNVFLKLKQSYEFQRLYDAERLVRRNAFIAYLSELSGDITPNQLTVVDVGWKGTIQDNLFALLCRNNDTPVRQIIGYYIGLINEGAAGPRNIKQGLLFSSVGLRSPKFNIFNENRALFEVLLAADHGSVIGYEFNATHRACAIRGEFEEREMITAAVLPVQHQIFIHFDHLVKSILTSNINYKLPFKIVVKSHARMVFHPTRNEMAWFSSLYHVENYGVFEHSKFSEMKIHTRPLRRLLFRARRLKRRDLGFWPWKTLRDWGGALPAMIYATFRRLQP